MICFGFETKMGLVRILVYFYDRPVCSVTSIDSSCRDLLNNVAEHESILKINQNKNYPRFSLFAPKTGMAYSLERVFCETVKMPPYCSEGPNPHS